MDKDVIWLVDDEAMITGPLRRTLRTGLGKDRVKYELKEANDPVQALAQIEGEQRNLALVIADIMMPTMNGLNFLRRVRELYPMAPRMVLTGYADKNNAVRAINELSLFHYVEKPWEDERLRQLVRNALVLYRQTRIEAMFRRYVPVEVIEHFVDRADGAILQGRNSNITVLFLDFVGFTELTEAMEPQGVVGLLNDALALLVEAIHRHAGILDKYTGDGLMAVFGAPESAGDVSVDACNAVEAALDMLVSMAEVNKARADSGQDPIRIRIGLNTGNAVAGNIGCPQRVNYTVVGDTVNTASRIENAARDVIGQDPSCILISQSTYKQVNGSLRGSVSFEPQGPTKLRGKHEVVSLYRVLP